MATKEKPQSEGFIGKVAGVFRKKKAEPAAKKADAKSTPFEKKKPPKKAKNWHANRLNVVEHLWGAGYTTPGGAERVKTLAPLLELDEKKSILVLGAGLGGIAQTLVEDTGVWVTGYEPDPELAEMGQKSMVNAGHKRKAPIRHSTLEDLKLKPKSFDAMLSLDGLHFVKDKKALFESVTESLRLHTEMLFITYVLPDTNPPKAHIQAWSAQQSLPVHLWPPEAMLGMLSHLDLDVRPPDDITLEYRNIILKAWLSFLSTMKREELLEKGQDVVSECARWATLISAIDRGGLKVMKFNCIRTEERRKSVDELMANAEIQSQD